MVWQERHKCEVLQHHIQYTHCTIRLFSGTVCCKNICEERIKKNEKKVMNAATEYFEGKCAAYF